MFDFLKREIRVTRNIDECNKIRELLLCLLYKSDAADEL